MTLCEIWSRNDGQHHFAEGFQQAFHRGLSGPVFGITRKQTCQFIWLCREPVTHHPFQHGPHAQGKREQAHQADAVVIALDIEGSQRQRMAFETREIALHQIFITIRFNCVFQSQVRHLMVGGIHSPAELAHGSGNGSLLSLNREREGQFTAHPRHSSAIGSHRRFLDVFQNVYLQQALHAKLLENRCDGFLNLQAFVQARLALSPDDHGCHCLLGFLQAFLQTCLSGLCRGLRLDQQATLLPRYRSPSTWTVTLWLVSYP